MQIPAFPPLSTLLAAAAVALALPLAAPQAQAALIAYEGFDFTAADITGTGSGSGWGANTWSGSSQYHTSTGLTYSNAGGVLATTGASVERTGTGANVTIIRSLSSAFTRTNGTELWISFLSDQSSANYHNLTLFNTAATAVLGFGSVYNGSTFSTNYAFRRPPNFFSSSTPVVTNEAAPPQLIVTQLVFNADNSTTAYLYLNPTLGETPLTTSAIHSFTISSGSPLTTFDRVRLEIGSDGGNFIDEVRLGTTFADVAPVIPESHAGALLLGSLACLFARRRRPELSRA